MRCGHRGPVRHGGQGGSGEAAIGRWGGAPQPLHTGAIGHVPVSHPGRIRAFTGGNRSPIAPEAAARDEASGRPYHRVRDARSACRRARAGSAHRLARPHQRRIGKRQQGNREWDGRQGWHGHWQARDRCHPGTRDGGTRPRAQEFHPAAAQRAHSCARRQRGGAAWCERSVACSTRMDSQCDRRVPVGRPGSLHHGRRHNGGRGASHTCGRHASTPPSRRQRSCILGLLRFGGGRHIVGCARDALCRARGTRRRRHARVVSMAATVPSRPRRRRCNKRGQQRRRRNRRRGGPIARIQHTREALRGQAPVADDSTHFRTLSFARARRGAAGDSGEWDGRTQRGGRGEARGPTAWDGQRQASPTGASQRSLAAVGRHRGARRAPARGASRIRRPAQHAVRVGLVTNGNQCDATGHIFVAQNAAASS